MTMHADTEEWLREVGLGGSKDPMVSLLLDACKVLDNAAAGADIQATVTNNARAALHKARQALQKQLEQSDSLVSKHRYRVMFAGLAARTMGWVDITLLSEELRDRVAEELLDVHDVTVADPTVDVLD